ncbi:glycoside hydrolase family 76 protein [Rothia sp. P7181]|uniref:glycoside hydrolase family 76 protein n=1 Tax=Rothia sp. P7181 TaxID=3402663 RepID=UPI003AE8EBF9
MEQAPSRKSHRYEISEAESRQLKAEYAQTMSMRAETAGSSVLHFFAQRALSIPGTLLGAPQVPDCRPVKERLTHWHFWWQAHFLDCALDASFRAHRHMDSSQATRWFERSQQILRGIRARNFGLYTNTFYDDMAWLALAVGRMNALSELLYGRGYMPAQDAGVQLFKALRRGATEHLGGGMFWSTDHDFKNTPATAPAALAFARAHQHDQARALVDWLQENLWDERRRAYLDGIKILSEQSQLEDSLFSYNQGPILSALLEIHGVGMPLPDKVQDHISALLEGIVEHFTEDFDVSDTERLRILRTGKDGDGGLFTGILVRYLAQVALSVNVRESSRSLAGDLVVHTAEVLWEGRREFDPTLPVNEAGIDVREIRGEPVVLFSPDILQHSSQTLVPGAPVELSSQLQGWMILEAAARVLEQ